MENILKMKLREFDEKIKQLQIEELNALRIKLNDLFIELSETKNSIESQLEEAKTNYYLLGKRAEEDWFQRAKYSLSLTKQNIQKSQILLGALCRNIKMKRAEEHDASFNQVFYEVVKKKITGELLNEILQEVKEIVIDKATT